MKPRIRLSYARHRYTHLEDLDPARVDVFAVPGSPMVPLGNYAAWLREWRDLFTAYTNLDIPGNAEATQDNQDALEARGLSPMPVYHAGEPCTVLEHHTAGYPYVALHGLGAASDQRAEAAWLASVFKLAADNGTALHGLGLSTRHLLCDYPFYSVDSDAYTEPARQELVVLWNRRCNRLSHVDYRDLRSVYRYRHLFPAHGLRLEDVTDPQFMAVEGTRDHGEDMDTITTVAARAWLMMSDWLTGRHQVPPPPLPRHRDHGTKLYLTLREGGVGLAHQVAQPVPA